MSTQSQQEHLHKADQQEIKKDLALKDPAEIKLEVTDKSEMEQHAEDIAKRILAVDPGDTAAAHENKRAIETMGLDVQRESSQKSAMLKAPIKELSTRSEEGGEVANALVDLKIQVEELDPAKFDFEPGWLSRMLGFLPFIGRPLKRYFTRYESAQTVLAAITQSLRKGQQSLERDNITLKDDQAAMRELTQKLEKAIKLGQMIDLQISARLDKEIQQDDPKYKFIQEEILFPLRQRIQDLQQQMVVNQQGILTIEIIIRNNKELIRGVNRALNVTMSALEVAVTLALALNRQKIVLDKVEGLNTTTNNLIAGTAENLKTQGTEIHKMASSTTLDMEVLKQAFNDIRAAMDEISRFRQEALPQMAHTIVELDKMTEDQEKAIRDLEEGDKINEALAITPD